MTVYAPTIQPWMETVPGKCSCEPAWEGRGMVDDRCYWHRLIDAIGELRAQGWTVTPDRKADA